MKQKLISFILTISLCFMFFPTLTVSAAQIITDTKTGEIDGYNFELWKDTGNTTMTLNGGATFSCQWDNINNALFRIGKKFDCTKTHDQLGNISLEYACDYNPSGNSYLCLYGWTKSPLVEYYIVDSWGTWRPPGATSIGTITVDGGTYDVYETTRVNQPSIEGNTTFKQYWSVRTTKRTSGTISASEHFKQWEKMGLQMGKFYEAALTVEGYQSSGKATVTKNNLIIGSTPSSPQPSASTNPPNSPKPSSSTNYNPVTITDTKTGSTVGGFDYELWKDSGTTSMTLNGDATFSCKWSNINNALFRIGKKFDCTKTHSEIGNIAVDYACDYNPSGNSYLCLYGWTKSPLVEYYIVDSWGTWRPPGATSKGTITVDGGTYDVYETTRVNQPSIEGNTTFKQYWSVRTTKRTSGTISASEHFKAWEKMGMQMGKFYEASLTVEGYQSSGSANVTKNDLIIGNAPKPTASTTPSSPSPSPTSNNSSWKNTADISWIDPSKSIVAFAFDDGPVANSTNPKRIQDALAQYNMHATFFYCGQFINNSTQAEIQRAYDLGFEVANHTYTHSDLTKLSTAEIQSEINQTSALLKPITGLDHYLVRPPYLATNPTVLSAVNVPLVNCSVDTKDWNNATKDQIINTVLTSVKDGSILLMHENYESTAAAVEYLIPELIKKGYVITSVSELMKIKGCNATAGKIYNEITGPNITTEYKGGSPSPSVVPSTSSSPSTYAKGDLDHDGSVNILDARLMKRYVLGITTSTAEADLNNDDSVDIMDALIMKKIILGTY